jgi:uncharacterized protein YegL
MKKQMSYSNFANSLHPAHYVFIINTNQSMQTKDFDQNKQRIDMVADLIFFVLQNMLAKSLIIDEENGALIRDRYKIALITYNSEAVDALGGFVGISDLSKRGRPKFVVGGNTNTYWAFQLAESLIQDELVKWKNRDPEVYAQLPAPVICHITDGEWNAGPDPTAVVRSIMNTATLDGNILVENVIVSKNHLSKPIGNVSEWKGITSSDQFSNPFGKVLWEISSVLPSVYRDNLSKIFGYCLSEGARMIVPLETTELLQFSGELLLSARSIGSH